MNRQTFCQQIAVLEPLLHGFAYLFFISVSFCGIELTKSCFQRDPDRLFGVDGVGNQRAKIERGDHTGSIGEGYLCIAKVVAFCRRFHMRQPTPESSHFLSARRAKLPPRRSDRFAALLVPNCRLECVRETSVVAEPNRWLD